MEPKELFYSRAEKVLGKIRPILDQNTHFFAGGAFLPGEFGDIDIWAPDGWARLRSIRTLREGGDQHFIGYGGIEIEVDEAISTSRAITAVIDGTPVQFCSIQAKTLEDLLYGFDFGVCQIGMDSNGKMCVTENYHKALYIGSVLYLGSQSPGVSLLRLLKYAKRPEITWNKRAVQADLLKILHDIMIKAQDDPRSIFNWEFFSDAESPDLFLSNLVSLIYNECDKIQKACLVYKILEEEK